MMPNTPLPAPKPAGSRLSKLKRPIIGVAALAALFGGLIGANVAFGDSASSFVPAPIAAPPGAYPAMPKPDTKGMTPQQITVVQRGEYLATAGDCLPCHTAPGAKPFSGGLSIVTPFGTLYSPNITPDKTTGIGKWTDTQFWDAVHYGVAPGSSLAVFPKFLYPAMPYTSYAKLSKPDVMAIKAYLDAIPAVDAPHVPNKMLFPFNIRASLLGWRIMFFNSGPVHYKKDWSPAVRNGAYLAEALGHCSECHSPRNLLFAVKSGHTLAGGQILGESWFAPNISSSKEYGIGGWSREELVSYLHNSGNMKRGSAFGPMKAVVDNSLSQLPKSDIEDLAAYLQTATPPRSTPFKATPGASAMVAEGGALYAKNCAACHQANGEGVANVFPNLKGNQAAWGGPADDTISAILGGLPPWHPNGPAMPAFGSILNDHQIAAIANYVRTAWGNPGVADATAAQVLALRGTAPPHDVAVADADFYDPPPIATAAARKLGCPLLTDSMIGPGSGWMRIMQDATPATLPNRTRMFVAALRKANPNLTADQMSHYLLTAYCPVVAEQTDMSLSAKKAALDRFMQNAWPILAEAPAGAKQGG
ncbi:MAG TPA: c-type cytochrome [Acidiphilium sp.]